jgi:hypothetical protein
MSFLYIAKLLYICYQKNSSYLKYSKNGGEREGIKKDSV